VNSYSQYGEDKIVSDIFGDYVGNGLEIGAWGVKDFSNSRSFIERGWPFVLVEFSPGPVRALVEAYGESETVKVVQAAVTPEPNHCLKFRITDNALSTADPKVIELWKHAGGYFGNLWVQTLSMEALMHQFFGETPLDYASIDTEGTSVDLVIAMLRYQRPRVIVVEHDGRHVQLMEATQGHGYRMVHSNQTNAILERAR